MSKKYLINEKNITDYRSNQKDFIFANTELNHSGFPKVWPIKNETNNLIFISFVDATITDKKGNVVCGEKTTFDVLDAEVFDKTAPNAITKIKFLGALLDPKLRVRGGVYYKGKFYTGQMKKKVALPMYKAFMAKVFRSEDRDLLFEYFPKDKYGNLRYFPIMNKDNDYIIFSAVNASILDPKTKEPIKSNINFEMNAGFHFDLNKKSDLEIADTVFSLLNGSNILTGFYYKGKLLKHTLNEKMKHYLQKGFIKKNFDITQMDYLKRQAFTNEKGELLYAPLMDKKGKELCVYFQNGKTPFGEKYEEFVIYNDDVFNPRLQENQYKLQIIERVIEKNKDFEGTLYIDGVLVHGVESEAELKRRKEKVEKIIKCRIDGDPDFSLIFNNFTTDDRDNLLRLCDVSRDFYPDSREKVKKKIKGLYNAKEKKNILVFKDVNAVDKKGEYRFKKNLNKNFDYSAEFNEEDIRVFKDIFKKNSLVRGGVYFEGKNINRKVCPFTINKVRAYLKRNIKDKSVFNDILVSNKKVGNPYKIDKKSRMLLHWPSYDKSGKEVLLSIADADVWFKVGRHTVKAVCDLSFDIQSGKTFGLVGESGSGKTTISRAILGINKLRKGGIYWKGKLISSGVKKDEAKANKKNIQMIFQDPAACLNERANIDYIVSEGLYSFHLFKNKDERLFKVVKMLREVGLLPEHLSRYPHEFSGGQRQRIGIARALVIEPELVLADEPISALDVSIRAQVLNLLRRLQQKQNLTYLFIAHDLSIIRYISDQIAVMHNGFVVESGEAEEIYQNPLHPYTKSLLTAIPQPDPKTKESRIKIHYEQGKRDYAKCRFVEMRPNHYVLVDDELIKEIQGSSKPDKKPAKKASK